MDQTFVPGFLMYLPSWIQSYLLIGQFFTLRPHPNLHINGHPTPRIAMSVFHVFTPSEVHAHPSNVRECALDAWVTLSELPEGAKDKVRIPKLI